VGEQHERILDQFTRQAPGFANAPVIHDEAALQRVVEAGETTAEDVVLDVACGPGRVACAFAKVARHVTGIDLTPAMLDEARKHATELGLTNTTFQQGDVLPLPFADASFSIVVSRFAFHHFPDPAKVLAEMHRVCRPGGRVVVVDLTASPDPEKAAAFHRMEVLRDPSHTRALTMDELRALFASEGLQPENESIYRLKVELDGVLSRSFPKPGDEVVIRRMFEDSLEGDTMGLEVRRKGEQILFSYLCLILAARKRL
jgi:ubiquinone/menaquinone biosynthesis C-methylase UbiE